MMMRLLRYASPIALSRCETLSQVATLRDICEGHCQNHRVRSSNTALANEKYTERSSEKGYQMADITSSLVMIVANG